MKKRYSYLINPLQITIDLIAINIIIYNNFINLGVRFTFLIYVSFFWLITSYFFGFYKVFRYTNFLRIINLLVKQFIFFTLGYFAFFGYFGSDINTSGHFYLLIKLYGFIAFLKFSWFFLLNKYRSQGKNNRFVIIIGYDQSSKNLIRLFEKKPNLGYRYLGFFSKKNYNNSKYLGHLKSIQDYILNNEVDEMYCSISSLNNEEIKKLNKLCLSLELDMKLIPEGNDFYSKSQKVEYYDDAFVVIDVKKLPFNSAENYYLKRTFDILFSIFVCLFVFPIIVPILWIMIKMESKGPLIFKQPREGLNGKHFTCYKFRSMKINNRSNEVHATKNDSRITKIGAFMRKTSIDELPQFINVLKGDMSIVGPRPHLESLSIQYQKVVDDYLKRHIVKPGITGLAQIRGYRGEITKNSDIKNRVRLDIFYIENWSFFLDIKIIIKTFFNMFTKEEKAY